MEQEAKKVESKPTNTKTQSYQVNNALMRPGQSAEKAKENALVPGIQKGKASAKTEESTKRPGTEAVATNRSTNGPKDSSLWMQVEDLLTLQQICATLELPVGVDLETSLGGADGSAYEPDFGIYHRLHHDFSKAHQPDHESPTEQKSKLETPIDLLSGTYAAVEAESPDMSKEQSIDYGLHSDILEPISKQVLKVQYFYPIYI